MSGSWEVDRPGRFTVGALGDPGRRVFYFQVFATDLEVSVKCEKQQAQALAEHLVKLLADLPASAEDAPAPPVDALPPTELEWVVGSISIGVDRGNERLVVLLEELLVDEEDDEPRVAGEPGRLRVSLSRDQVRAFAAQVEALAAQGRPRCRLCEQPMDPEGHACPRLN